MSKNKNLSQKSILLIAIIAFFAAIICLGCFMRIPLGPIPIVLQNVLCILTAGILGSYLGGIPTLLFLVAGLIGLPVYSGGTSGISVWAGPTGGFFPGYLIGAIITGFICGRPSIEEKKITWKVALRISLGLLAGMIILYIPGLIHFGIWATKLGKIPADKTTFAYVMSACCLPFLPGDAIKLVVAIPITLKVRPLLAQYVFSSKVKTEEIKEIESENINSINENNEEVK